MDPLFIIGCVAVVILCAIPAMRLHRRRKLLQKYGNPEVVNRIVNKILWQGETSQQLMDSFGPPADIDTTVTRTERRDIWKYLRDSKNQYHFLITLENNAVIGWERR